MRPKPRPQEIYKHFKGNIYQIITMARHSESGVKMVVYQQLYAPFEVYVRPLEMFMSKIDTRKYPNEKQVYRFERLDIRGEEAAAPLKETSVQTLNRILSRGKKEQEQEPVPEPAPAPAAEPAQPAAGTQAHETGDSDALDEGVLEFLDADSYEERLNILAGLHHRITDDMITTMAIACDLEVEDGDIEERYESLKTCLLTMERYECNRLR